jgi:hypothetical protein
LLHGESDNIAAAGAFISRDMICSQDRIRTCMKKAFTSHVYPSSTFHVIASTNSAT